MLSSSCDRAVLSGDSGIILIEGSAIAGQLTDVDLQAHKESNFKAVVQNL